MRVLFRLVRYAWRYRSRLLLAYACLLGATAMSLAVPRLLGSAVDLVLAQGSAGALVALAAAILGVSVLRGAFSYGQQYLAEAVSQRVAYDLRNAFFQRLQRLSFAFHDRQNTGDLMSKGTVDVENVRWFVNVGLIRSLHIVVLVGGVATLILLTEWRLGLVSLAAVPLVTFLAVRISRRLRGIWRTVQDETGHLTTVLQENLAGVRVVRAFGGEEHERAKFRVRAQRVAEESYRANRLHAANTSTVAAAFNAVTGVILWLGGRQVLGGTLTPGELTYFILYLGMLAFPIRMAGWVVNTFSRAASAGERIFGVLDAESPVRERPGARDLGRARGHVRFEDVSFGYRPGVEALRHVSFEARPGQRIALVGAPGSGKSTVASLIPRFYDVSQGRVTLDGVDVRDVTLASLRRNVGIVFQDVFLFGTTIRENIAYGRPDASFEEIVAAARAAQLHDFIAGLPQGYDTVVGERGITLSGGQRQRLAIARTLLLDPPVLVLDDSTSSVDAATERLIQQALERVMQGRTTFVIAHRISSLRRADVILVLRDGEVVERGTHEELLARGGLYRQVYEHQVLPAAALAPAGDGA